jgi:hypothetical protein
MFIAVVAIDMLVVVPQRASCVIAALRSKPRCLVPFLVIRWSAGNFEANVLRTGEMEIGFLGGLDRW